MKYLLSIACILLLNSCMVFHSGSVSSGPLLSSNDRYKDIATGSSKALYFFGFGNIKKTELIQEAKKDLFSKYPLQKGEYYSNFTTDINKKIILLIAQDIRVTVSADILSSGDTSSVVFGRAYSRKIVSNFPSKKQPGNSAKNLGLINNEKLTNGDSLYYSYDNKNYKLYIASSIDKESVILKSADPGYKSVLVSLAENVFFVRKNSIGNTKSGEKISIDVKDLFDNSTTKEEGEVLGFYDKVILVKTKSGFHKVGDEEIKK